MEKQYRKIEFRIGCDIDSAIEELKSYKELVCGEFNGCTFYSDVDDIDSAYKKVTGKTKSEFDESERQRQAEYERKKIEHKKSIPRLTTEWIEKGKIILDEKYYDLWAEIVPIRLDDIYEGMELQACLDIVKALNEGYEFETAKEIIEDQGHSGMSFGLVCSMVVAFADRGKEFVTYLDNKL